MSQHVILVSTASTFYGQLKIIVAYCPLFHRNNFSTPEIQRVIFNIYMVNESDPRYTQYVTTSNTYLNCIHILRPIENGDTAYIARCRPTDYLSSKWGIANPKYIASVECCALLDSRVTVIGNVNSESVMVEKCRVSRWNFADNSFHSRDTMYFRFTVRHFEFCNSTEFMQRQSMRQIFPDKNHPQYS